MMMLLYKHRGMLLMAWLALVSVNPSLAQTPEESGPPKPPPVDREFRAAWVATVANIDWPSRPGLPVEQIKGELQELFDLAVRLKLNAVVLQVRPACDAIYPSELEPWSPFITGKMGEAPDGGFDPLAWACDEARNRGLEVHAWFNPYRATHPTYKGELSNGHIAVRRPELAPEYGDYRWLEPTSDEASEHSIDVVLDVVRRYDIDAVHFDDYFYPYPISERDDQGESREVPFPDEESWQAYLDATPEAERLDRGDWRRDAVNRFIKRLGEAIHREKPHVKFGISPFGICRPGLPEGIDGFDQYDKLYADALLWYQQGWVDYLAPQLYWAIDQQEQSFTKLLNWWADPVQNPRGRHLWPGLYTSKTAGKKPDYPPEEIVNQIVAAREQRGSEGHIHFSIKALQRDWGGVAEALQEEVYTTPALVPATPWLAGDTPAPPAPTVEPIEGDVPGAHHLAGDSARLWVLQKRCADEWSTAIVPGTTDRVVVRPSASGAAADALAVRAVDRYGRLSEPTVINLPSAAEE